MRACSARAHALMHGAHTHVTALIRIYNQLQIISSTAASSASSLADNFRAIGTSLACNLVELDLSQNSLSGTVPFEISAFSQMQTLNMAYNRLSGT